MGFLDNLFKDDKKKSGGGQNKNSNSNRNSNSNNPLANIRRNVEQMGRPRGHMAGPGYSLGGAKPGEVLAIDLPNPGPLGVRVEKRSNNSASAIVNDVVPGSQAEACGLKRGDVLCFAGSNGQNEIPYDMFLQIAKSTQRPIHLEARRFDAKTKAVATGGGDGDGSADAEARRRAMIAAAEAREKKHKRQTKTIKHVTKSTLLKEQQRQQEQQQQIASSEPQTEASRRAAESAKRKEAITAARLGYNPYEATKKTAGEARAATTTTQHGAITAPGGGSYSAGGSDAPARRAHAAPTNTITAPADHPPVFGGGDLAALPVVAPPQNPTTYASSDDDDDPRFPHHEFEMALAMVVSSDNQEAAKSGLKISRKLIANATTKGQKPGEGSEKFRRVRLANPKIKAAIVDVPGNVPLMLSVGFELHQDDANPDEFLLVFPPGFQGPGWLPAALKSMEDTERNGCLTATDL